MEAILQNIQKILSTLVPLFVSLGVVFFVWGIVQYVIADSEEAKKNGKNHIIYGILGFTVIVSLWGLVKIVVTTFGLNSGSISNAATEACNAGSTFADIISYLVCIANKSIIPFIFSLALLVFVFGIVKFFIIGANEEAKRTQGREFMIWSIIAFTVMLSLWGLVKVFGDVLHTNTSVIPKLKE